MNPKKILKSYLKIKFLIIFVLIYFLFWGLSKLNNPLQSINPQMDLIIFIIIPQTFFLLVYSVIFSLILGSAHLALNNKSPLKAIKYTKYFFGNFLVLLLITALNFIILYILTKYPLVQNYITNAIIYTILTLLIANFIIFSLFFHTLNGQNIFRSLIHSILLAKKNYFKILLIEISYFLISIPISYIPYGPIKEAISFLVIYPLFSLILVNFFENVSTK